MPDQNKRRMLKMLSVTPLVTTPVFASVSGAGFSDKVKQHTTLPTSSAKSRDVGRPLQIHILDTTAVPDNNVLVRNDSNETLLVSRFMPGHVYFDDKIMDLNEAIGNTPLLLHAGQSKAFNFKLWPVVNAGPVEYVWADHALEKLSDDTSVVTLGAFMADTNAVLYVKSEHAVAS